jgi:serine/threonine-protein kinase RsbW
MSPTWVRSACWHVLRLEVQGIVEHRGVVLRALSAACRLCAGDPEGAAARDLRTRSLSAVGEAFNNIALHGYRDRAPGRVTLEIAVASGELTVRLLDNGASFDPRRAPPPDLGAMPEGGFGAFIIRSVVDGLEYAAGNANVLTLRILARQASSA